MIEVCCKRLLFPEDKCDVFFLPARWLGQSEKLVGGKLWPCLKTFLDLGFVTLSSHTANSNFSLTNCVKFLLNNESDTSYHKHDNLTVNPIITNLHDIDKNLAY